MTDENTKDTKSLADFIEQEVNSLNKATRRTWIVGAAVGLFLVGYLYFALFILQFFLNPRNAALLISTQIQDNAPELFFQTEQTLRKKAVKMADEMSEIFISSIPKIRVKAQEQITSVHQEMIPFISLEFQQIFREYVEENSETLRELVEEEDIYTFASHFTSEMMKQLGASLNETLNEEYGGRNLEFMSENLLTALQAMDEYLSYLVEMDPADLDRRELLQKKILVAFARRLVDGVQN